MSYRKQRLRTGKSGGTRRGLTMLAASETWGDGKLVWGSKAISRYGRKKLKGKRFSSS